MPDIAEIKPRRVRKEERPDITLPSGRVLSPRYRVAAGFGVTDKTLKRKNTSTTYIGNLAYVCPDDAAVALIGDPVRRNQPPKKRR